MTIATLLLAALGGTGIEGAVELGRVRWEEDHAAAWERARASGRPVLVLFQEIPGCATCQGFGRGPLSHPLVVDAIESEFVPLAVNNRTGRDGGLLARYGEPAFNNPVVRYFAAGGEELLPRRAGVWGAAETVERMVEALRAARRPVPAYLELARAELADPGAGGSERAVFAMSCFWQGQAALGALPGVLDARPGWLGGEVVEVRYDPRAADLAALLGAARASGCARRVLVEPERLRAARDALGQAAGALHEMPRPAPDADDLHALRATPLWHVPLTDLQALRANAALFAREDPRSLLAPFQRALLERVEAALARDPRALAGLERPARLGSADALDAYRRALEARLGS